MNKEQYVQSRDNLLSMIGELNRDILKKNEDIDLLHKEINSAARKYITECSPYKAGEKVIVVTPEATWYTNYGATKTVRPESRRYAIVSGSRVIKDEIHPVLKKCKYDGTVSKVSDYVDCLKDEYVLQINKENFPEAFEE